MQKTNIKKTGSIGEAIVLQYLKESGEYDQVSLSDNVYDMHKDISASSRGNKLKIEVKTRTVIRNYYAMPLEKSQWYKADNADKLYFITNPTSRDEHIRVYEATNECYSVVSNFGSQRVDVRMYDLGKMKVVKTITDLKIINQLYELSVSSYKQ